MANRVSAPLMRTAKILMSILASTAIAPPESPAMTANECAVWAREAAFAQTVERHDAAAFASFIDAHAVFSAAATEPVHGRDRVVSDWRRIIAADGLTLHWRPQFVSIGGNANLAMSRGPFFIERLGASGPIYAIGTFTSVWARADEHAPWLVVFDGGGPPPSPVASRAEAEAFFNAAPATCALDEATGDAR